MNDSNAFVSCSKILPLVERRLNSRSVQSKKMIHRSEIFPTLLKELAWVFYTKNQECISKVDLEERPMECSAVLD